MQTQTSNTFHNAIMEAGGKDRPPMLAPDNEVLIFEGSSVTTTKTYMENHKNVSQDIRDQLNAEVEAVQIILTGIDNDIYYTVDACPNACEMWKAIERLKQGESINVQDIETNLYWEFGKFTSRDGESLESYYSRNRGKAIVNSPQPIYDEEPSMVAEDDEMSKDKEIDKLMALISLSFKKIYKPTNNNLRTSSNTSRANQDNSPRINRGAGYDNQRHVARECQKLKRAKDAAYYREKMLLCKHKEARIQLNAEQADWRDDTDDESEDQELEAHYMYMAQIQEVFPDAADSGPIFDTELVQKVPNNDNYNVFAIECEHPEQSKSVHDTYLIEQDEHNVIIDSLDMNYDIEQIDQHDDDVDLANEQTNKLMYNDLKKSQTELDRCNDVEYASKVEIDCAKAKGDLISYKMESQQSFNKYTQQINDLNQTISEMKKKLSAHQETISILSQAKEAQIKLYKTREDKELDKVIALEKKVKVLDNIVFKTGQSVQTMNMLNSKCQTSFAKPEFIKKAQRANPRLYDIGCYNDNLALMLAPESEKTKMPIAVPVSTREPKRTVKQSVAKPLRKTVASESTNQKPRNTTRKLYERVRMYKLHIEPTQTRTTQLPQDSRKTNKCVSFSTRVNPITSVSRPHLKSNLIEERVMLNNSQGKKQEVEEQRRNVKLSKNKMSVTACNDSLNAKTLNVNFVCATCGKCVLNEKHYMYVLKSRNGVNSRTKMPIAVPVSTREPKRTVKQSVAKPLRKTVASESTNQKPRNTTRKLYERVSKAC
nr:hypothetical protein [Tanacetum cinerariifolium]